MTVEHYKPEYRESVLYLIEAFVSDYAIPFVDNFNGQKIEQVVSAFNPNNAFLLIDQSPVGILAGIEVDSRYNSVRIFEETFFYISSDYGSKAVWFIKEAERMIRQMGFGAMIMSVLNSKKTDQLKRLYERMGYQYLESHYLKNLT